MKKLILLLLFAIQFVNLSAFDFQTVYSHRTTLFTNANGNVKSMRIDSVKFNGDSILYPLKNIQQLDYNCYTPYGASWLGSKIIINKSWNYFLNAKNDTLKIKTDAKLLESWFILKKNGISFEAIVSKIDTLTVLGVLDSVKTIKLSAYGFGVYSNKFNHGEILLSKNFGLLKTYPLLNFPSFQTIYPFSNTLESLNLVGQNNPTLGIQNLTWFDVFDFQAGDEIHILENETPILGYPPPQDFIFKRETIKKYLSRQNYADSIRYTVEVKQKINNKAFSSFTGTEIINQNNFFNTLPDVAIIDHSANIFNMYVGAFISKTLPYIVNEIVPSQDSCWHTIIVDGCFSALKYMKGLGGPYYYCRGLYMETEERDVVYYKKGNKSWGIPLILTGLNPVESNITVLFNQNHDQIIFNNLADENEFVLFDMKGTLMMKTKIYANQNTIQLKHINQGLYLYLINQNGKLLKSGKLVKQ